VTCASAYTVVTLCIRIGLNRSASLLCYKYCILGNLWRAKTTLHLLLLFFPVLLCLLSLLLSWKKVCAYRLLCVIQRLYGTSGRLVYQSLASVFLSYSSFKKRSPTIDKSWVRSLQYLTWCAPCVALRACLVGGVPRIPFLARQGLPGRHINTALMNWCRAEMIPNSTVRVSFKIRLVNKKTNTGDAEHRAWCGRWMRCLQISTKVNWS
jgi:hypothetical protein